MISLLLLAGPALAGAPDDALTSSTAGGMLSLSLEDALRRAVDTSETVLIAQAQVQQADGQQFVAYSGYLPQVNAALTYQRTFATEFDDLFSGFGTPTGTPPYTETPTYVPTFEGTTTPDDAGAPSLPFGQPNTWRFGLTINQQIFGGGRTWALTRMANAGKRSAQVGLEAARARAVLDTAQAYYDAYLSDQLLDIAEGSLSQATATLSQTELNQSVGRQAEFDLLRARVAVDNQRVAVINARRGRDIARQRLSQLLSLSADTNLLLAPPGADLDVVSLVTAVAHAAPADSVRAPVRQLEEAAAISRANTQVARADALPSVAAQANIGWVRYPNQLLPFGEDDLGWLASSSATVALNIPLFNGGRVWGGYRQALGQLRQSEAQLLQTTEFADLDAQQARSALEAAEANWTATEGVVGQAQQAYEIAELRFTEGLSTQLELADARLLLSQALVNRAQAARDLAVARIRTALLASLPL